MWRNGLKLPVSISTLAALTAANFINTFVSAFFGGSKMNEVARHLVNPIALARCTVRMVTAAPVSLATAPAAAEPQALGVTSPEGTADLALARVLDISFVRLVIEDVEPWTSLTEGTPLAAEFRLDRTTFTAEVALRGRGEGWLRLGFEKIVPSARAHLRSFLSPKKIGESLVEDWRNDTTRHYHGLNESELWFNDSGGVLFTYLDQTDAEAQFIIRMADARATLRVGKILRREYMELNTIDAELPLIPLSDREIYSKLGECRDIVTNFRPSAQMEYNLKQRLLKVISDNLYSTSYKVERETPSRASLERSSSSSSSTETTR